MPFVNKAQVRACYAADDPKWDCHEWAAHTKNLKALPKGPAKVNPDKTQEKRAFVAAFLVKCAAAGLTTPAQLAAAAEVLVAGGRKQAMPLVPPSAAPAVAKPTPQTFSYPGPYGATYAAPSRPGTSPVPVAKLKPQAGAAAPGAAKPTAAAPVVKESAVKWALDLPWVPGTDTAKTVGGGIGTFLTAGPILGAVGLPLIGGYSLGRAGGVLANAKDSDDAESLSTAAEANAYRRRALAAKLHNQVRQLVASDPKRYVVL